MSARQIQVVGLDGIGEVDSTTDLTALIAPLLRELQWPDGSVGIHPGDIVAVTSKIVSKAEGRVTTAADRQLILKPNEWWRNGIPPEDP